MIGATICAKLAPLKHHGGATGGIPLHHQVVPLFFMPADHTTNYEQGGTTRYFHFYVEFLYLMVFDRLTNRPTDIPKHLI